MEKDEIKIKRDAYEFYGVCHDLLRDLRNEPAYRKALNANPEYRERVRKLLGAKEGEPV